MPPEVQKKKGIVDSFKADSWSLGLLIFHIYEERPHNDTLKDYDPSEFILHFSKKSPALAQDLILKLTHKDKSKRLSVKDACCHQLFAGIN